nr:MAG TPA: hypothetical protein [Inoviridae sp.]
MQANPPCSSGCLKPFGFRQPEKRLRCSQARRQRADCPLIRCRKGKQRGGFCKYAQRQPETG